MLQSLETLTGASVIATDGEIGKVCNFLFDDQSWRIRYVVVDVRNWLNRHDVLIAPEALEHADWSAKRLCVRLTREQVRHSPDVDTRKPVSRQQEIAMNKYYGWPRWIDSDVNFPDVPVGRQYIVAAEEDPHLRSVEHVIGYSVWAADGSIGRLESFVVDEDSWHLSYVDVQAGDWLLRREVLIPTDWVKSISWPEHRVQLRHSRSGF